MAKYYVGPQGFEVRHPALGRQFIEQGTLVDDSLAQWAHCVGQGPPIDAIAANQSTYDFMIAPGGMGYPVFRVQYHLAAGIVPDPSTRMPAAYFTERHVDGSPVPKRP
jgi:hypothetical protein